MNVIKEQIRDVFTNLEELKEDGIWFSGKEKEGEYKGWYSDGQLWIHCFYNKEKEIEGEYKLWYDNGQLYIHCYLRGIKSRINANHYVDKNDKRFKGEYKEWMNKGELIHHIIFNNDGSIKEKII